MTAPIIGHIVTWTQADGLEVRVRVSGKARDHDHARMVAYRGVAARHHLLFGLALADMGMLPEFVRGCPVIDVTNPADLLDPDEAQA